MKRREPGARQRAVAEAILQSNVRAARADVSESYWRRHYGLAERGIVERPDVARVPDSAYPLPTCSSETRKGFDAVSGIVSFSWGDHGLGEIGDVALRLAKAADTCRRADGLKPRAEARVAEILGPTMKTVIWHHGRVAAALEHLAYGVDAWRRGDEDEEHVRELLRDVVTAFAEAYVAGVVSHRRRSSDVEEASMQFQKMFPIDKKTARRTVDVAALEELARQLGDARDDDEEQAIALAALEAMHARPVSPADVVVLARNTVRSRQRRLRNREAMTRAFESLDGDGERNRHRDVDFSSESLPGRTPVNRGWR